MTNPLCGTPHYRYPETLCTEPAHHYIPDRDPHAGPLIINSREIGGAAWDEPKEQHMSDRHTVDSITSDALDQLYAELDRLTAELTDYDKRNHRLTTELRRYTDRDSAEATAASYTHRAHQAEAAIARVRAVIHVADTEDVTDWQRGFRACSVVALGALAEPAVAAAEAAGHTYLSTGCLHGHHDYCQAMTGHAGAKRPGQCKFCAAPCLCSCHQSTTDHTTEA